MNASPAEEVQSNLRLNRSNKAAVDITTTGLGLLAAITPPIRDLRSKAPDRVRSKRDPPAAG